jgi:drug/metabolite transporter (DMT)-like permease
MKSAIFSKPLPYLALLAAHVIWGVNFVVAKVTLDEFPPQSLAFLRFFFACLLISPFFLAHTQKGLPKKLRLHLDVADLPKLVAVGILIITFNITFFFEGIKRTTAINASILYLTIPILSVLFGWLFLKEKVYFFNILGILAGLLGGVIIIGLPQLLGTYQPDELLGNFFIILSSISWVIGAIISRQLLKKYPSTLVTAIAFLVGVVTFLVPAALEYFKNPEWPFQVSALGYIGLLYMILLSSISAYFLFEWALSKTSVIIADLFQYIEPFVAAAVAVLLLHERVSFSFTIGAALIALGVYWGTFAKEAHHRLHKYHRH